MPHGGNRAGAEVEFAQAGLGDDEFRFTPAQSSWAELEAGQNQINHALSGLINEGRIQTSVDPRLNAVVISLSAGTEVVDRGQVERSAEGLGVKVQIKETSQASLRVEPQACDNEWANCDLPMRGGVRIEPNGTACCAPSCTAAFKAISNSSGARFILTAGHCVPGVGTWTGYLADKTSKKLGTVEASSYPVHDYAAINASGTYWDTSPWPSSVAYWGKSSETSGKSAPVNLQNPIVSEGSSFLGEQVCHSGSSTGTTCGTVSELNVTGGTGSSPLYHLTEFKTICSSQGDSGGPVFAGNTALGIYSSDDGTTAEKVLHFCQRTGYYTEITEDTDALGVSVAPRPGPANVVSPDQDDNSPGPRAITQSNGTIDVFYRTTSGELGHQWYVQGSGWSSATLPGSLASDPHPTIQSNGTIDVFWRTPGGELGHAWDDSNGWHTGTLPGSVASDPHPAEQSGGTIDVLYRTPSGQLGHDWYQPGGEWHSNTLPGSVASDPYAVTQSNGTVDGFFRTSSGGLGHAWTQGGTWSEQDISGASVAADSAPHPVVQANGTVDVFWKTPSGELGHAWDDSNGWHFSNLSASLSSDPHAIAQGNGQIDVFWRTPGGELGHAWDDSNGWHTGTLPGSVASDPHVIAQSNGTVDVFYRTPAGELGHDWYTPSNGWSSETRPGSLVSDSHPTAQSNGTVDVFYRTPAGELGHQWYVPGNGWSMETRPGPIAARPPQATSGVATAVGSTEATLNATVNPEGSPTTYQFEYGTTTSYGSKKPAVAESLGSGTTGIAASQILNGLAEGTTYHYRVVATNSEGTTNGEDKTFQTQAPASVAARLDAMAVTEPFDASSGSLANFSANWSPLGWAAGSKPKGDDSVTGWRAVAAYPTVNGAFFNPSVADTGPGVAAIATMAVNPANVSRYFSLWLDMPSPSSTRAGYELRFNDVSTNAYDVTLSKWQGGVQTALASKSGYSFSNGNSLALVDQGGTVSVWTNTGAGFSQLLSAGDATFASGNAGLEGGGSVTRLTNFKAGSLLSGVANMNAALNALALNDSFATNENPLSGGGKWAALN
ncbi:MAG TPA: trypsin-like serine protease, partial [Solirubrobacterales bacterium]|nr:trypsin-like serine protease [Solirubrobacterales bacterium]